MAAMTLTCRLWLRAAGQAEVAVGCSGPSGLKAGRGPGWLAGWLREEAP